MAYFKKCDFIIIALVVLASFSLGIVPHILSSDNITVNIYQDSSVVDVLDINKNIELYYSFNGIDLKITVLDKKCFVESSTCPDNVCVRTGDISSVGETIVCVPAGLVVVIKGNYDTEGFDAIAN